jgi:lipoprotein NlpI
VDELSGLALMTHNRGNYIKAGKYYDQILEIDPSNQWAINNKKRLP